MGDSGGVKYPAGVDVSPWSGDPAVQNLSETFFRAFFGRVFFALFGLYLYQIKYSYNIILDFQ